MYENNCYPTTPVPQGIWTGTMDGSDVNTADRSPSGKLLAIGDDFGKVK